MQRMLVFLTLILLVGVAGLGVVVMNLSTSLDEQRSAALRDARDRETRPGIGDEDDPSLATSRLDDKLQRVNDENNRLRADVRKLQLRVSSLSRQVAAKKTTTVVVPKDPDGAVPVRGGAEPAGARARDENGNLIVSDEDMEYHRAVQAKVDRTRRIEGQVRNYNRRIESLETRGEIAVIPADAKTELDKVLRAFVTLNDDLVTQYVRSPSDEIRALSTEDRREQLRVAREKYASDAKLALAELLEEPDAAKVAERVFTNPWGARSRKFVR
ncbi:MAG: hypothetical protein ACYTGZ_22290 [Planctomycetota bacterium]|jgi:TolA-binding protein